MPGRRIEQGMVWILAGRAARKMLHWNNGVAFIMSAGVRSSFNALLCWNLANYCYYSYVEGIDVLYSTNTIHMARNPMMLHLPQLLLPQRLASISSVEMRWFLYPYQSGSGFEEFHLLAASLLNFTNLKSLHVSIEGKLRSTELGFPSNEMVNDVFLKPMETSIRRMPTLQRCQIELPLSLYDVKRFKIREEYVTQGYFFRKERIWRNLPKSAEEDVHLSGYWVWLDLNITSLQLLTWRS